MPRSNNNPLYPITEAVRRQTMAITRMREREIVEQIHANPTGWVSMVYDSDGNAIMNPSSAPTGSISPRQFHMMEYANMPPFPSDPLHVVERKKIISIKKIKKLFKKLTISLVKKIIKLIKDQWLKFKVTRKNYLKQLIKDFNKYERSFR
jgi:hypothetical protein